MIKKSSMTAIVLLFSSAFNANAAMVNFSLSGEITVANPGNPYNVSIGDLMTASGVFDDIDIGGAGSGETYIDFSTDFNNMEIIIGNTTYTDIMDNFGGGFLIYTDGVFSGIDYSDSAGTLDSFGIIGQTSTTGVLLADIIGRDIQGNWDKNSFTVTTDVSSIPVPAAVWLFGSGLVCLAGMLKRRRI